MMRKAIGLLAIFGAALTANATVHADTLILDTYGNGAAWGVGGTVSNSGAVGDHAIVGGTLRAPANPTQAAYAAMPFTVKGLPAGQSAVTSVTIVFNIQPPAGSSSNFSSLRGAIFAAPSGATALNAAGVTQIGKSFAFDTTASEDASDPLGGSLMRGNGLTELLGSVNLSAAGITLQTGQSYLLVLEPKDGLNPTANDVLLDYGLLIARTAADVANSGAQLSNSFTTARQAQDTYTTGSPGNALNLQNVGLGHANLPGYFGAQISVGAAVVAPVTISGTVSLEGVSFPHTGGIALDPITVAYYPPASGAHDPANPLATQRVAINPADGSFSFTPALAGSYDLAFKTLKSLRVIQTSVNTAAAVTGDSLSLTTGDSNNDNSVDSTDFGNLIGAFNTSVAVPGNGYDPTVDFNYDGSVDSTDFGLLIGEFNNVGAK